MRILGLAGVQFRQRGPLRKRLQLRGQPFHDSGVGGDALRNSGQPFIHLPLVVGDERHELLGLAPVQPDDGVEVGVLLVGEDMRARRDHVVDVARVDHQHLIMQVLRLALVKKPQRAGQAAGVEELVANGHHHVDVAGLGQLFADVTVFVAGIRGTGRHDETSAAGVVQVGVEVLNPQTVGVADGACPGIGARQTEGQTPAVAGLAFHLLGIHAIDIERRVGHDEVALANEVVHLVVEGVALTDVGGIQPVHHQIHARQLGVGVTLFLAVEGDGVVGLLVAHVFDEVAGLHEHARRSTGWVQHETVVWLDDVDDHAH